MKTKVFFGPFALFLLLTLFTCCQRDAQDLFQNIPEEYPILKKVLENNELFKTQIIFTRIDRNEYNEPVLKDFTYQLDDEVYFYPASTVKLPIALLALEWLNEKQILGLGKESIMLTDSVRPSQIPALGDTTAENQLPSIAHYIKKILLVSDNDAYNRLYELLGQEYINHKMKEKGLLHTVINHRLSMPMSPEENRHFNPITFFDSEGQLLLEVPARYTEKIFANPEGTTLGEAYFENGNLMENPMSFQFKNKFALSDFHETVQRVIFPENFNAPSRFNLKEQDREFVLKYMSMLPGESDYPAYGLPDYYDSYSKFFKFGTDPKPIPNQFRLFNKTGNAYGQLLDGTYFVDFENNVEFFVSAVIYTNANETLNDNQYEYEEIGFPFFAELGEYLYQLELKRRKNQTPDLTEFIMDYP
jgi:hypothetical protein